MYGESMDRVAAFGALAYLLAEGVRGEYSMEVSGDYAVFRLDIPVWAKLSAQSEKSLAKLAETAELHEETRDSFYVKHVYHLLRHLPDSENSENS